MSETDVRRAMQDARRKLQIAGVPDPVRDASALFLAVAEAQVGSADTMSPETAQAYARAVDRRVRREPVSHITGKRAFWMHDFIVTPDVLDPRPETETLVETGLELLHQQPEARILDLGTGSGCILLSLLHELRTATGIGADVSEPALEVARRNADLVGVADRARFLASDWFAGVTGRYDLIVSNPPYIPAADIEGLSAEVRDHEPLGALTDGADGLSAYAAIARSAAGFLKPGGQLIVEIGAGQAEGVERIFVSSGLACTGRRQDLDGRVRVLQAASVG